MCVCACVCNWNFRDFLDNKVQISIDVPISTDFKHHRFLRLHSSRCRYFLYETFCTDVALRVQKETFNVKMQDFFPSQYLEVYSSLTVILIL